MAKKTTRDRRQIRESIPLDLPLDFKVDFGEMLDDGEGWDCSSAYRVGAVIDGVRFEIPLGFAREKDAELGRKALVKAGAVTRGKLQELGMDRIEQIMCETLQW